MKETRVKKPMMYLCSVCKECERARALQKYHANSEHYKEMNKKYKQENKESINTTRNAYLAKKHLNHEERLKRNMKCLISAKIRKTRHTGEYLGAPMTLIVKWLEFNFGENMSWENYGKVWHIDHTIPIDLFDLQNENEALVCFCWMNIIPLTAIENLKKSNKLIKIRVFKQEQQLRAFASRENIINNVLPFIKKYTEKFKSLLNVRHA